MKTYKQFTQDLEESELNTLSRLSKSNDSIKDTASKITSRIPKPIKKNLGRIASGVFRIDNLDNAIRNPNKDDLLTRATSAIGVAKPFSGAALFGPEIINQSKPNSTLNKSVDYLAKQNNKTNILPFAGKRKVTNRTDLGKKIGDFLGFNKKDTYGASDLKGTTSGMG